MQNPHQPHNPPSILVGLIGAGIQASRSPRLHEQEARELGIHYLYRLIDLNRLGLGAEALPRLLDAAQWMGFTGLNITYPCKQAVLPWLDALADDTAAIGAVNTVVFADGKRIGYNTDAWGFTENFQRGLGGAALGQVVLLGAGGAGAAVAHSALALGAQRLVIHDVDGERAAVLVERLAQHFGGGRALRSTNLAVEMAEADGLIQATPVGMLGLPGLPLAAEWLHPALWVAEVIYFPLETELLKAARARGCRTVDGGGMAVFQAAGAFRLFTGATPDHERMLKHFATMGAG